MARVALRRRIDHSLRFKGVPNPVEADTAIGGRTVVMPLDVVAATGIAKEILGVRTVTMLRDRGAAGTRPWSSAHRHG
jgi:hypothetical protein